MKRRVKVAVIAVAAAVAVLLIVRTYRLPRVQREECVNNMRQILSATLSYSMENKLQLDRRLSEDDMRKLSAYIKGGRPPVCPAGDTPYALFTVLDGPRSTTGSPCGRGEIDASSMNTATR